MTLQFRKKEMKTMALVDIKNIAFISINNITKRYSII